jgi:hypothetical protein
MPRPKKPRSNGLGVKRKNPKGQGKQPAAAKRGRNVEINLDGMEAEDREMTLQPDGSIQDKRAESRAERATVSPEAMRSFWSVFFLTVG